MSLCVTAQSCSTASRGVEMARPWQGEGVAEQDGLHGTRDMVGIQAVGGLQSWLITSESRRMNKSKNVAFSDMLVAAANLETHEKCMPSRTPHDWRPVQQNLPGNPGSFLLVVASDAIPISLPNRNHRRMLAEPPCLPHRPACLAALLASPPCRLLVLLQLAKWRHAPAARVLGETMILRAPWWVLLRAGVFVLDLRLWLGRAQNMRVTVE